MAPEYNRKHSFVRLAELHSFVSGLQILQRDLAITKATLHRHLKELYTDDVINEWFDLYVTPIENQINTTKHDFSVASKQSIWPRRPLVE